MREELLIVEDMKKLGLTEYEIKAYLKLLEQYPVNGYMLSKNSGIPRSRIYEVLESLKNKQMVFEEIEGESMLYHPIEPNLLVSKLRSNFEKIFDNVEEYTYRVYSQETSDNKLISITGRDNILACVNALIGQAKTRIAVSIWEEEIKEISKALDEAKKQGVVLKGIYFGKNNPYEELISHRRIERYLSEKKERYMTVIVDGIHVIYGVISRGEDSKVTWAKDPGFVDISEDYICHDLMVNIYSYKLDEKEREEYEKFLDDARCQYFNFTAEECND